MKKALILLCLALINGITHAATQNKPDPDKPMRLYVESYSSDVVHFDHQREDSYDDNGNYAADWAGFLWWQDDRYWEISSTWFDGIGGNGDQIDTESGDSDYGGTVAGGVNDWNTPMTYSWPMSSWPNVAGGMITYADGSTDTISSPVVLEHRDNGIPLVDLTDSALLPPDNWNGTWLQMDYKVHEARQADAVMKLQVGGKAKSNRQNLIVFNGLATQIVPVRDPFYHSPNQFVQNIPVPAQNITVMGKALGSDDNLYVILSDGDEEVVTPKVAGMKEYTFGLTAGKYAPIIAARGNEINYDDISVTNPEFCVGQQLTFWLNWNPPNVANATYFWHLPDKYVNEAYQYSSVCTSYRNNSVLLTNATQQCWYVNGQGGACSVRGNLQFSNGQTVSMAAAGNFTIFRPSAQCTPNPPFSVVLTNEFMSLGDTWDDQGRMSFDATITSTDFSGSGNWVQLINRSVIGDWPAYARLNTYGGYWLDNDPLYNTVGDVGTSPDNAPVGGGANGSVGFSDNPGIGCYSVLLGMVDISDGFKTYLAFQPSGAGSIWVTLGRVNWGWSGHAGVDIDNGIVQLENSSITPPTYTDTDEFPVWSSVFGNSR